MWCRLHSYSGKNFRSAYSTIFALSSGQGKCGVAVIRVSGCNAREAILKKTKRKTLPPARSAVVHPIFDSVTKIQIDRGIVIWFPGPKSFTGEDSCEFHVHGGPAVITSMLASLSKLPDFRAADAGEFTKRAFMEGKMDLTEVEGLADIIHAETEQQRRQALLQMEGSLATLYASWRRTLLQNLAHVEAYIDFSEDDNIEDGVLEQSKNELAKLCMEIKEHLADSNKGERLHNGVRTVIVGEPNVGKSSLLNYLAKRPAAIVTPIAGTTRDVVEVPIDVGGYPMIVADTAGMREDPSDEVEIEGIKRAKSWSRSADLVLLVLDAQQVSKMESLADYYHNYKMRMGLDTSQRILPIVNKIDTLTSKDVKTMGQAVGKEFVCVSCKTESGLRNLLDHIGAHLQHLCGEPKRETPTLTQARYRCHLTACVDNLEKSLELFSDCDITLAAHTIRQAMHHLGRVTGHVTNEDILDVIFKDFCIGK